MRERFKKLRVFTCILLILALVACGKKDSDNKDNTASQNDTSSNTVNGTELAIGDFKIKVNEGFESPQLQEASSIDPSSDTIVIDSNLISITYNNADTFNRGI